jgi:ATP-dependent DNA helicase RecG
MLPYRGLGSGIKRALEAWPQIDFLNDRDGCLFTATVHRKTTDSSMKKLEEVGEKLSQNQQSIIEQIVRNPYVSARELSEIVGISSRKIEENIRKLKDQGVVKRIGPAKGGHWEVI